MYIIRHLKSKVRFSMIFDFSLPDNFAKDSPKKDLVLPKGANGLVVHCCCAPCSTSLVECLIFNKVKPLMFFYNPNIYPLEEYEKRKAAMRPFNPSLLSKYEYEETELDIGDSGCVNGVCPVR